MTYCGISISNEACLSQLGCTFILIQCIYYYYKRKKIQNIHGKISTSHINRVSEGWSVPGRRATRGEGPGITENSQGTTEDRAWGS